MVRRLLVVWMLAVLPGGCATGGGRDEGARETGVPFPLVCDPPRSTAPAVWTVSPAGEVVGVVWDVDYGGPSRGAAVALLAPEQPDSGGWRGATHRMISGSRGEFRFESVRPGRYRSIAQAIGKEPIDREPVEIVERPVDTDGKVRVEMRATHVC